jgi:hypothetical protein
LPKIEVDEKVLVWCNVTEVWRKRYSTSEILKDGQIRCFHQGANSWSCGDAKPNAWVYWKLFSDETVNSGNLDDLK